jgi:Putative porin
MKGLRFYIILIITVLFTHSAQAQFGSGGGGGLGGGIAGKFGGGGGGAGVPGTQRLTLDTSDIYFFFADEPNFVFPFSDSLLGNLHQYDPIRQQPFDFASLGNLGSATRPLFFQPTWRRGFDVGLHQFDPYLLTTADVRYYKITQAYTQGNFTQGTTQSDAQFNVRFSRNFANGLNFSIEHRRINNIGAYDTQLAKNIATAAGMWIHPKSGRYDGYLSVVTNANEQQNNGGAAEDLSTGVIDAFQVDTYLSTANTRHSNRELAYTQYFYLNGGRQTVDGRRQAVKEREGERPVIGGGQPDSLAKDSLKIRTPKSFQADSVSHRLTSTAHREPSTVNRQFTLYHQIAWRKEAYKFSDKSPDTTYYNDIFLVDTRGLRQFLEVRKLENSFKLQTFKLKSDKPDITATNDRALPRQSDLLEVGLLHSMNFVEQEPVDTSIIHNLFLTGRLNFSPSERLRLNTYAHLAIGANAGDFRLSGELFLNLKKIGTLQVEAVNQLYSPSLLPQRFYVTQKEVWKNSFRKTLETSVSGTYSLPQWQFSVGGQYHLLNNLVYFDSLGLPRQSGTFSIVQLTAKKDFSLGPLHLDNAAFLQQTTSDVLPLPQFYTKHSLYLEGKIFKKVMLTKIGVDARLIAPYKAPGYNPLIGQFFIQKEQELPFTPLLDAFLSFKVKTFRFFFKVENLLTYPLQTYFYQTANYPMPFGYKNGGMRMGISWRLVD